MPKLSICIPTYNRAEYLRSTLASLAGQLTPDVEVVVSDNASTDQTSQIVAEFQRLHGNIKYSRSQTNQGADRNYLRVVSLAGGEYCWLFGSDDLFPDGAVAKVLDIISGGSTIYLLDRIECDASMRPRGRREWLHSGARTFHFDEEGEILEYFGMAGSLGAAFSFLSSILVRRSAWNGVPYDQQFTGTAYSHAFVLLSLVNRGCSLTYLKEPAVLCRLGNDSFANNGLVRRRLLDIDGYGLLARSVFRDRPAVRTALLNLLLREHPWSGFSFVADRADAAWPELKAKLLALGVSASKLRAAEWLAKAGWLRDMLFAGRQRLIKAATRVHAHLRGQRGYSVPSSTSESNDVPG